MARGLAPASSVPADTRTREARTEELLGRLQCCTDDAERQSLTEELVEANLGLCDALANRYANRGADRDDL
ncbi:MAG: RNA polymerase subunit sigma-28, partial [Actinobacteria bacterium]|nr:RNA polymerase subunit sigma-28 [Actinomycetota bacterium]